MFIILFFVLHHLLKVKVGPNLLSSARTSIKREGRSFATTANLPNLHCSSVYFYCGAISALDFAHIIIRPKRKDMIEIKANRLPMPVRIQPPRAFPPFIWTRGLKDVTNALKATRNAITCWLVRRPCRKLGEVTMVSNILGPLTKDCHHSKI